MGVDRTGTGTGSDTDVETVEQKPAADRPPPPPPDRPGAEGFPSRADSRRGAAAANAKPAEVETEKPGGTDATGESSNGQDGGATDKRETSGSTKPESVGASATEDSDSSMEDRPDVGPGTTSREERPITRDPADTDLAVDTTDRDEQAPDVPVTGRDTEPAAASPDAAMDPADRSFASDAYTEPEDASTDPRIAEDAGSPGAATETADSADGEAPSRAIAETTEPAESALDASDEAPGTEASAAEGGEVSHEAAQRSKYQVPYEQFIADSYGLSQEQVDDAINNARERRDNDDVSPLRRADAESDPPTGEELLEMGDEGESRRRRVAKELYEEVDDIRDLAEKVSHGIEEAIKVAHPPTGQAEISTAPEIRSAPHEGISVGDLTSGGVVLGMLAVEGTRKTVEFVRRWTGR